VGKGIYVATSGSIAQLRQMEVLSNNLANARTTGFKSDRVTFAEMLATNVTNPVGPRPGGPDGVQPRTQVAERDKHFVEPRGAPSDMTGGSLVQTDNPLDVAITGNGMLRIETPRGVRLTKGGQLVLGRDGLLMTTSGHPVLSDQGKRIMLPPDQIPEIDPDGTI
jgi:flagellar basal-body rod protein FlgF